MTLFRLTLIGLLLLLSSCKVAGQHRLDDILAGEQIYIQCTGCHAPGYHRTGPKHCGLIGRQAGSVEGFVFSEAMKNSDIMWTEESLDNFLQAPLQVVPGTSMGYVGLGSASERMQLIAYLGSLDSNHESCQ